MHSSSRRTLLQALIFSVMFHVALLLSVHPLVPVQLDTPVTAFNVVMNHRSLNASTKEVSSQAVNQPVHRPVTQPSPVPARLPVPAARPVPVRQIAIVESKPVAISVPAVAVREGGPQVQPVQSALDTGGAIQPSEPTPRPVREVVNADDLRQYRISLATSARRFKRYPPLARERGWEGTVELEVTVNSALPMPEVALIRSSEHSVLDDQALEMMAQAGRVTAMPEGLKGRDFRFKLPIKFSLENDR